MVRLKDEVSQAASEKIQSLRGVAEDAWDSAQDRTRRAALDTAAYARRNPAVVVLGILGLGFLLGFAARRRRRLPPVEPSIAPVFRPSGGVLLGLIITCASLLRRTYAFAFSGPAEAAESAASGHGGHFREGPAQVATAARQKAAA